MTGIIIKLVETQIVMAISLTREHESSEIALHYVETKVYEGDGVSELCPISAQVVEHELPDNIAFLDSQLPRLLYSFSSLPWPMQARN